MQLNKYNQIFINFLFFLFPLFLISGALLPDVFVSIISLIFLFFIIKKKHFYFSKNIIFYFFLIFYLYLNINSIFSNNSYISFQTSIPYIRMLFFALAVGYLLKNSPKIQKTIFISFLFAYIILLFDSIFQFITGLNILGHPVINNRISSFFGSHLVLGSFVARTLPILLAISFDEKFKIQKTLQILLLLISGVLIYLSSERVAFFYYMVILFCYLFLNFDKKNLIIFFIFIIFFYILSYLKPSSYDRLVVHTLNQAKSSSSHYFSNRHQLHYLTAYNMYKDNMLIGHGLKSFRYLCSNPKYIPYKQLKENIVSPLDGYIFINKDLNFIEIKASVEGFKENVKFPYSIANQSYEYTVKNGDSVKENQIIGSFIPFTDGCNTHPHNVHLQFLSELGLIGYIFLLVFSIFVITQLYLIIIGKKEIKNNNYKLFFILIGLFLSVFPFIPSGNFFNNWLSIIFYFNLGFLINYLRIKK
jgi:O-antigen ligase